MTNRFLNGRRSSPTNSTKNFNYNVDSEDGNLHSIFFKLLKYVGLLFAFIIVLLKTYLSNQKNIEDKIFTRKLVLSEWVEDGASYFTYNWETTSLGEPYLIPFLVGMFVTIFTWGIVYLDSRAPGENPPSPFTKSRYRNQSYVFHTGYLMAILSGVATFGALLFATV